VGICVCGRSVGWLVGGLVCAVCCASDSKVAHYAVWKRAFVLVHRNQKTKNCVLCDFSLPLDSVAVLVACLLPLASASCLCLLPLASVWQTMASLPTPTQSSASSSCTPAEQTTPITLPDGKNLTGRYNALRRSISRARTHPSDTSVMQDIRNLVEYGGLDINYTNNMQQLPFIVMAATSGNVELVRYFVTIPGIDIDAPVSKNSPHLTALHEATGMAYQTGYDRESNSVQQQGDRICAILKCLLDAGANPNGGQANQWTPVMSAAQSNWASRTIPILVQYNADVNASISRHTTALTIALSQRCIDGVRVLMEHGAHLSNAAFRYGLDCPSDIQQILMDSYFQSIRRKKVAFLMAATPHSNREQVPIDQSIFRSFVCHPLYDRNLLWLIFGMLDGSGIRSSSNAALAITTLTYNQVWNLFKHCNPHK
jgi:ankyrin repeat protein